MAVASTKANEAGFDVNRGFVPLPESFINLSSARSILEDAIEKQKLVQLPITVQREVLANLQSISKSLLALAGGTDEIVNLTNAIEALNTSIWKYGLHNLSDQVLGYQKKLNQIKNQELQIAKAVTQLDAAKAAAIDASTAAAETEQKKSEVLGLLEQVKQGAATSISLLEQIKEAGTKSGALFATIQQNEKQSGELFASIKTANNELLALDTSIRNFYAEVDGYRKKITQTSDDASRLITSSESVVKKLAEDTTTKVDEAVGASQASVAKAVEGLTAKVAESVEASEASSKAAVDELTSDLQRKIEEDTQSFSSLTSTTKANITTFQTGVEGDLRTALEGLGTASSKLITDTEDKVTELEKQLAVRSEETIETNRKKTAELLDELAKLKEQVREQIQQATGFALFGAFQARQNEIVGSKNFWARAIAVLVGVSIVVTTWIAYGLVPIFDTIG